MKATSTGTPVNNTMYVHRPTIMAPQVLGHATFNVTTGGTAETMYVCLYNAGGTTLLWSASGSVNSSSTVVSVSASQYTLLPGVEYIVAYGQSGTTSAVVTTESNSNTFGSIINQNIVRLGTAANGVGTGPGCPATTGVLTANAAVASEMVILLEP